MSAEFAAVDEPSAEPLLGSRQDIVLSAGGTLVFYGDGDAGKTTLGLDLVLHLAAGLPWLGLPVPRPCRVLVVENEGPRGRFRVKLREKSGSWTGPPVTERVHVLEEPWALFTFANEGHRRELRTLLEELEIDVLAAGPVQRLGIQGGGTLPRLGDRRIEKITPGDVSEFVATLVGEGYARGTIRKTLQTLAMILDDAGGSPNPARDKHVRLPREEPEEINPPTAAHLEAVYRLLPSKHRLAFLFLDWSGARVSAVDLTLVSDYDEPRRRVRLRAVTTKTRRALWIDLHPALADALERQLGPREDRGKEIRLFAGSGADALRTSIAKACRAAGVPLFSPHDLRHRRISLLHLRGVPWARIGEFVGQRNLSVTADVYSHVLGDETELDYPSLLV